MRLNLAAILWFWFIAYCIVYIIDGIVYAERYYKEDHKTQRNRLLIGAIVIFLGASYIIGRMFYGIAR